MKLLAQLTKNKWQSQDLNLDGELRALVSLAGPCCR